jgi:hypothetical protein
VDMTCPVRYFSLNETVVVQTTLTVDICERPRCNETNAPIRFIASVFRKETYTAVKTEQRSETLTI